MFFIFVFVRVYLICWFCHRNRRLSRSQQLWCSRQPRREPPKNPTFLMGCNSTKAWRHLDRPAPSMTAHLSSPAAVGMVAVLIKGHLGRPPNRTMARFGSRPHPTCFPLPAPIELAWFGLYRHILQQMMHKQIDMVFFDLSYLLYLAV